MEENQKISGIEKVYELKENFEQAIQNAGEIMSYQQELESIIEKAKGKKHDFSQFLQDSKEEVEGYQNQIKVLSEKTSFANAIIEIYEKGKKEGASEKEKADSLLLEQVITTFCFVLGIYQTETQQEIEAEKQRKMTEKYSQSQEKENAE